MDSQQWKVGAATITAVVEEETLHIPPEFFFPDATAAAVAEHAWLVPDYADEQGNIGLRVQAFVIEVGNRRVVVDPCVGNGKMSEVPFWHEQTWPFIQRFRQAGFDTTAIDTVVHTHLHADHVGWDTYRDDDAWVPTFPGARHIYTQRELDWCKLGDNPGTAHVYEQSIAPIEAAGLAHIVAEDADLGDGMTLEPSTGHTPGHVSLWLESNGERALLTGDFLHHPVQFAVPAWAEVGDFDVEQARATRRRMFAAVAESGTLVLGTHFPTRPAGRIVSDGDAYRFVPEAN